jgi:dihydrofolate reductase
MKISLVVAMAANRVIGRDNGLPWHLPADLQHFRRITMGKPILMGRRTWESIGRPLPGRTSIVVTRDSAYTAPGCLVVHSLDMALQAAAECGDEAMVIGGAELYRQVLPRADTLYLTQIHAGVEGDTFFPELEASEWREVDRRDCEPDEKNPCRYSFIRLDRISPPSRA